MKRINIVDIVQKIKNRTYIVKLPPHSSEPSQTSMCNHFAPRNSCNVCTVNEDNVRTRIQLMAVTCVQFMFKTITIIDLQFCFILFYFVLFCLILLQEIFALFIRKLFMKLKINEKILKTHFEYYYDRLNFHLINQHIKSNLN